MLCVLCAHLYSLHDNRCKLKLNFVLASFLAAAAAAGACLSVKRHKAICHATKGHHCGPDPLWKAAERWAINQLKFISKPIFIKSDGDYNVAMNTFEVMMSCNLQGKVPVILFKPLLELFKFP